MSDQILSESSDYGYESDSDLDELEDRDRGFEELASTSINRVSKFLVLSVVGTDNIERRQSLLKWRRRLKHQDPSPFLSC